MNFRTLLVGVLLYGHSATAVIYGRDDRADIYQTTLTRQAGAVAVAVGNNLIDHNDDGTFSVNYFERLDEVLCPGERFREQTSVGVCTGVLISDRYVMTAGHCVLPNGIVQTGPHPFCDSFSWYFGYDLKKAGADVVQGIPESKLYKCKRMIRAENLQFGTNAGNDFALLELDRPVSSEIEPARIASKPAAVGDQVYTIGHPWGLPAKYSGKSAVLKLDRPHYFSVNLDTFEGNSGGPVYDKQNEVVGILVSGHQTDFVRTAQNCSRPNRCDTSGLRCTSNVTSQTANFVQHVATVLPWLPRAQVVTR